MCPGDVKDARPASILAGRKHVSPFDEFAGRKRREAAGARFHRLTTVATGDAADLVAIDNDWTRRR
jgi:hypothetical protein